MEQALDSLLTISRPPFTDVIRMNEPPVIFAVKIGCQVSPTYDVIGPTY